MTARSVGRLPVKRLTLLHLQLHSNSPKWRCHRVWRRLQYDHIKQLTVRWFKAFRTRVTLDVKASKNCQAQSWQQKKRRYIFFVWILETKKNNQIRIFFRKKKQIIYDFLNLIFCLICSFSIDDFFLGKCWDFHFFCNAISLRERICGVQNFRSLSHHWRCFERVVRAWFLAALSQSVGSVHSSRASHARIVGASAACATTLLRQRNGVGAEHHGNAAAVCAQCGSPHQTGCFAPKLNNTKHTWRWYTEMVMWRAKTSAI